MPKTQKHTRKTTHRSSTTLHTRKQKTAKINVIFDLDATLINSVFIETIYGNQEPDLQLTSLGPHRLVIIPGKKTTTGQSNNIMFYRPFTVELLEYLNKHPLVDISVWSAGEQKYVEDICRVLFGADWKKKLKIVISRKASAPKYTSIISQSGEIFDSDFENKSIKDLDVLFNHVRWGQIFTRRNTILIDDAAEHYLMNKGQNIIHVPGWDGINSCDTVLLELQQWFEKILGQAKSHINMAATLEFNLKNRLGATTGNVKRLWKDWPTYIKTVSNNNNICKPRVLKYYKCKMDANKDKLTPEQKIAINTKCARDNLLIKPSNTRRRKNTKTINKFHTTKKN
jgi:hypothetical protein